MSEASAATGGATAIGARRPVAGTRASMIRGAVPAIAAGLGLCASGLIVEAAERFQKLTGTQIRAKFIGMEMTDNVHFADVFGANGGLRTYSMGRKQDGKWRVEKDELCVDRGKDDGGCYQVWISGKNVEFRRAGLPAAFEGILQRPTARN
jgi:hypothetical protein